MSDIVKKYQHYFAESVKLQETVNEQAAYIAELEEAVTTLSEIFDSPEGKEALKRYTRKAQDSLENARERRKDAERGRDNILFHARRGAEVNAMPRTPEQARQENELQKRGGFTMDDAQRSAKAAFDTIQKRKRGLQLAGKQQEKIDAKDEARKEAEAKAKGIDRFNPHIRDETGRRVPNPYYKHREAEDIPPDFKLPG